MRYSSLLLTLLLTVGLTAAEFNYDDVELSWPQDGNFQLILASEVMLKEVHCMVVNQEKKLLYCAPATYIPQKATMMHPTGGDEFKGDKWAAASHGENLTIHGEKSGVIVLKMEGKCSANGFCSTWMIHTKSGDQFSLVLHLVSAEKWELTKNNSKFCLNNGTVKLEITSLTGEIYPSLLPSKGTASSLLVTGHGKCQFSLKASLTEHEP